MKHLARVCLVALTVLAPLPRHKPFAAKRTCSSDLPTRLRQPAWLRALRLASAALLEGTSTNSAPRLRSTRSRTN